MIPKNIFVLKKKKKKKKKKKRMNYFPKQNLQFSHSSFMGIFIFDELGLTPISSELAMIP